MDLTTLTNLKLCHFLYLMLLILEHSVSATVYATQNKPSNSNVFIKDLRMPGVTPTKDDEYLCSATTLDPEEAYVVQFEVHSENNRAHHVMLFGCEDIEASKLTESHWKCSEANLCTNMKIMFAWAKNAPPTSLPKDVGFRIGGKSGVKHMVLQIHYAHAIKENDTSGILLHVTPERQKYVAGIFLLLARSTKIPPLQSRVHADLNCLYESKVPIYTFAYRVHAHSLGSVIAGYTYNTKTQKWTLLGKGNPQWPQAFYPMDKIHMVDKMDILAARCTFNSTSRKTYTFIGSTAADEMCNFYIMYYTDAERGTTFRECEDAEYPGLTSLLPSDSDLPLPRNPLLEEHALGHGHMGHSSQQINKKGHGHKMPNYDDYTTEYSYEDKTHDRMKGSNSYQPFDNTDQIPHRGKVHHMNHDTQVDTEHSDGIDSKVHDLLHSSSLPTNAPRLYECDTSWPNLERKLGQVSAVSLDRKNNVVIFHRGKRTWDANSFDLHNRFLEASEGFIQENTVLTLDQATGKVLHEWGSNMFHMPHGLTIENSGFVWITDVALHQVMKFSPDGGDQPLLTLGVALKPGSDDNHFCKPTSVAVTESGEFFVADGYCNSRILKFSANGKKLLEWGKRVSDSLSSLPNILGKIGLGAPAPSVLDIPHKLVLAEDKGLICVADRENGRIQCFDMSNGTFHCQLHPPEFGDRLFSIAYTPTQNGLMYAVNGPSIYGQYGSVQGFVLNLTAQSLLGTVQPGHNMVLSNPHDIAVTADASTVFISEIAPNKIWKFSPVNSFITTYLHNMKTDVTPTTKSLENSKLQSLNLAARPGPKELGKATAEDEEDSGVNFTPSVIIAALVAIPVLLMVLITVFVKLRKQGHIKGWMSGYKQPNNDRFNLGNILQRHKGFDRISVEESDGEMDGSDSEVEEYTASIPKA